MLHTVHTPHIEKHISGSNEGSIEALVRSKGRLFSTGLSGFIVEYDLVALAPKGSYVNEKHTYLAVQNYLIKTN